jgi:hypothetical protein
VELLCAVAKEKRAICHQHLQNRQQNNQVSPRDYSLKEETPHHFVQNSHHKIYCKIRDSFKGEGMIEDAPIMKLARHVPPLWDSPSNLYTFFSSLLIMFDCKNMPYSVSLNNKASSNHHSFYNSTD